jgi:hypothetical protein
MATKCYCGLWLTYNPELPVFRLFCDVMMALVGLFFVLGVSLDVGSVPLHVVAESVSVAR